jgi:hypothetical protein
VTFCPFGKVLISHPRQQHVDRQKTGFRSRHYAMHGAYLALDGQPVRRATLSPACFLSTRHLLDLEIR